MARRRKSKKNKVSTKDISVVVLIVLGILFGVLIYLGSGAIGKTVSPILGGIMGFIKYILPVATILLAIYIACDNKDYITSKVVQYTAFLLCIMVIMTIYQISAGYINIEKRIFRSY